MLSNDDALCKQWLDRGRSTKVINVCVRVNNIIYCNKANRVRCCIPMRAGTNAWFMNELQLWLTKVCLYDKYESFRFFFIKPCFASLLYV